MLSVTFAVLTWNLKHGRAEPPAGRDLFEDFATALASWHWDAALLQEVPPWWPQLLGSRLGARWRRVLTSRNLGLPLRRGLATRWPDRIKSSGGGSNAIMIRSASVITHRTLRLAWWPERRWLQAVQLDSGLWVANLHLTAHDTPAAHAEARHAAAAVTSWAGDEPAVLGGDFNVPELSLAGFALAASHDVDYVFVRGRASIDDSSVVERGVLSDHAPVLATVTF